MALLQSIRWAFRGSLVTRLILGVVAVEAITLGVLVWNSVRLINSSHAELLERSIREETTLLANSLAPGLAYQDRATLSDVLSQIKGKKNLVYVAVYDRAGREMASMGHVPAHVTSDHDFTEALQDGIFDVAREITLSGQRLGELHVGYSTAEVQRLTAQTRLQNTAIAVVALMLSAAVTVLLAYMLTRGLRRLEDGARALQRGELDHRIAITASDEIGDLARTFNGLAAHLEETRMALEEEQFALERESGRMSTLLNGIKAVVWEGKPEIGVFSYVSAEVEGLLGYRVDQWSEPGFFNRRVHPDDLEWVVQAFHDKSREAGSFTVDHRIFDNSGRLVWVRHICTVEKDAAGEGAVRGLMLDITENKVAEERIVFLADHDALTGLINRRKFQERLEHHIAYAQRYDYRGALLFIDLDQFKYINDSYGHQAGDQFLCQVARRLVTALRRTDILGRLGGDEFGVIIPRADAQEAVKTASSLLNVLGERVMTFHQGRSAHISASIGITLFPMHGATPSDLLARADAAMYVAKDRGRNRCHLFDASDAGVARIHAKVHWERRIRHALAWNRFVMYYQPVVELATGRVTHYEALLRMLDDSGGLIPPAAFLDTAERFGLIGEIDRWVLTKVIQEQAASHRRGEPVQLAVNLSGRHFGNSQILELVRELLISCKADPHSIIFEVTETAAVENVTTAREFIESLCRLGCRFALDDFGVGFSSLHYLKNLPVDFIKIDGSFVRDLPTDNADRMFVKAITELAEGLGITTIAEFVESETVVRVLRDLGVHLGQGFHLGRPATSFSVIGDSRETTDA